MGAPLLVEFFLALPEDAVLEAPDLPLSRSAEQEDPPRRPVVGGKARRRAAVHVFCKQVQERYTEGTLLRLLHTGDAPARRAAAYTLGLLGSQAVCEALTGCLHDEDEEVARLVTDALWTVWFRGSSPSHSDELHRLTRNREVEKTLAGLDALIAKAPKFAEAYNQRAIALFKLEQYDRAAADCEAALRLNPQHFGAQTSLGQCFMKMRRERAALRAFRSALRLNPRLGGIAEAVRALENALGDSQ
jgi:tetratricopeptide (TPR) repeat protein